MGLWSSTPPPPAPAPAATPSTPDATSTAPTSAEPTPAAATPAQQSKADRDAAADAEFASLFTHLQREHEESLAIEAPTAAAPKAPANGFPETMSCLNAFDEMYYCYSLGGQFLNVYRYGGMRDCSQKSKDWRFCMKSKMYGPMARRAMVMQHFKEKEGRVKEGRNAEEVWELRKEPLREAFSGDLEDLRADRLD